MARLTEEEMRNAGYSEGRILATLLRAQKKKKKDSDAKDKTKKAPDKSGDQENDRAATRTTTATTTATATATATTWSIMASIMAPRMSMVLQSIMLVACLSPGLLPSVLDVVGAVTGLPPWILSLLRLGLSAYSGYGWFLKLACLSPSVRNSVPAVISWMAGQASSTWGPAAATGASHLLGVAWSHRGAAQQAVLGVGHLVAGAGPVAAALGALSLAGTVAYTQGWGGRAVDGACGFLVPMNLPVVTRWCDATPPGQAWETSPTYAALPSVFAPSLVDLDKCLLDVRTGVQSIKELRPDSAEFDAEARAAEHGLPVLHNVIVQTPRQVKQTQSAVARLATSVARSPGGQGSWFHRLLADTLARGFSGKAGLRDRAQKAAALLLHAQAQRSELLRDLAVAPVKITILCRSESVEPAYVERNSLGSNIFQSRVRLEEKKEWLAREGDKLRDLENRRDLIKLEEREIRELEKKTASGPGKLVANVHVACGCINAIKQEAKEMGGKMDAEQLVLEEALEIVKEVDGVIARGGWFPQVEVIQEGEAALVSSLQLYLSKVAEIYCKQEKSGWWKGKDEAD